MRRQYSATNSSSDGMPWTTGSSPSTPRGGGKENGTISIHYSYTYLGRRTPSPVPTLAFKVKRMGWLSHTISTLFLQVEIPAAPTELVHLKNFVVLGKLMNLSLNKTLTLSGLGLGPKF